MKLDECGSLVRRQRIEACQLANQATAMLTQAGPAILAPVIGEHEASRGHHSGREGHR